MKNMTPRMSMRWLTPAMLLAVALLLWQGRPALAEEEGHGAAPAVHHAVGGAETAAKEHEEGASQSPLPDPTNPDTYWSAMWVVIIFIVLLAVLYPTAWKGVLAGLKKREERIRKDIADAEASRTKAEATLREYNTQLAAAEARVRDMISKATADGERIAAGIRAHAQQESEEINERATRDIEAAKTQAIGEIYEQAASLSTAIAEKILRRNLNADDQRELVKSSLEQLQTAGRI